MFKLVFIGIMVFLAGLCGDSVSQAVGGGSEGMLVAALFGGALGFIGFLVGEALDNGYKS